MQVITSLDGPIWPRERSILTIGTYDGLHRGHLSVIDQVIELARERGCRSAVVTFDPHPAVVVRPESAPRLLTTVEQRLELLEQTGIDAVVVLPFDESAASEEAEDFVQRVFVDALGVSTVVVGQDFHFGRLRRGDVALLTELGAAADFSVVPVELCALDGVGVISSTAIRRAVSDGRLDEATAMLGRDVEVAGVVITGDQRGRTIGFPTANLDLGERYLVPADGVYAGICTLPDGSTHECAVNIGRRPTFYAAADRSLVEAHLLDFDGDLYGQHLRVRLIGRIRDERRFDGLDELIAQLDLDIASTRHMTGVVGSADGS